MVDQLTTPLDPPGLPGGALHGLVMDSHMSNEYNQSINLPNHPRE